MQSKLHIVWRQFLVAVSIVSFVFPTVCFSQSIDVWIGTTTPGNGLSRGVYHCQLNVATGRLTKPKMAAELANPGFVTLHPNGEILYATCQINRRGAVAAFAIERKDGESILKALNSVEIGDGGAAHLNVDRSGKCLLTAQYGGGSVAMFPIADTGQLGERAVLIKHEGGSKVVGNRQDSPHAHWVGTDADNQFAFVPDLGLDQVVIYKLNPDTLSLKAHGHGSSPPGGGPRHFKFHPNGRFAYVLNELALSVTVFGYDAEGGRLTSLQTIPTLTESQKAGEEFNAASEIRVHPNGKFLYAANRGHDSISVFRIHADTGKLRLSEVEPIRGSWPRNFNVDPTGRWLIAAGRDSNTLSLFSIDQQTGMLQYQRHSVFCPTPICVTFGGVAKN